MTNVTPLPSRTWEDDLLKTGKSGDQIKVCLSNFCMIFRHHSQWAGKFVHNVRNMKDHFLRGATREPEPLTDQHSRRACEWLHREYKIAAKSAMAHEAMITVAAENPVDPCRDYFDALEWDETPRLDEWLSKYAEVPETEYSFSVASKFLISAVARTYEPACKADCMLVLQGPQGALKSTLLNVLAGEFFSDQIEDLTSKDGRMLLHGPLIIEIAELDAMNKKEVSAVKHFLTTRVDSFRPPYGRTTEDFPRRCVFAGTVNLDVYLKDDTGGRRFWPVNVHKIDLAGLRANRDQIWAEAVHRYRAGENWWLEHAAERAAEDEQEDRRQADPWEMLIEEYLAENQDGPVGGIMEQYDPMTGKRLFATTAELLDRALKIPAAQQKRSDEMRIGPRLKKLGWKRKRIYSKKLARQISAYFPPDGYHGEPGADDRRGEQGDLMGGY
jgi:predicted P-loop ATPase